MISDSTTRQKGRIIAPALLITLLIAIICTETAFAQGVAPSYETYIQGKTVDFTYTGTPSNASNPIQRYLYSFGDGQSSYSQNSVHTYAIYGIFNTTLKVTYTDGTSAYSTKQITLTAPFLDTDTGQLTAGSYSTSWLALVVLCGLGFALVYFDVHPISHIIDPKVMKVLYGLGIAAGLYLYLGGKIW